MVAPATHGVGEGHDAPGVHVTHIPELLQEPLVHGVPEGAGPSVTHCGPPLEQLMWPTRHSVVGVQAAFSVHGVQAPVLLQTRLVPHEVPASLRPVSTQLKPEAHCVLPMRHALGNGHSAPGVHATHEPPVHT